MLNLFFVLAVTALTAAGIFFWTGYFRQPEKLRTQYLSTRFDTPFGLFDVLLLFFVWMFAPILVGMILLAAWDNLAPDQIDQWQKNLMIILAGLAQLTACVVVVPYFLSKYGSIDKVFGIRRGSLAVHTTIAVKAFCMVIPGVLAIQTFLGLLIPYEHETLEQLKENFSVATVLSTWFGAVVAAPACEEFVFRGVLQGWLQRIRFGSANANGFAELVGGWNDTVPTDTNIALKLKLATFDKNNPYAPTSPIEKNSPATGSFWRLSSRLRWWTPVVISSALFAAVHIGQGLAPISLFFFSLGLGFLYRFTGSIVPSIMLHFLLNAFTMFWLTLQLIFEPVNGSV